ncbi:MAG: hypothetical protein GY953_46530, partial [bacterium]|nr:hypothetical protein [bacterium]
MKKSIQLAAAALIGVSFSAGAWWGPYGGAPYWGGYAPTYGYAPWGADPFQTDPFSTRPGDFADDPFMPPMYREMFKQSDAERKQWQAASEARREAAKARATAQRAASEARRKAWRDSTASYSPYGYGAPIGYPMPFATPAPAAVEEAP